MCIQKKNIKTLDDKSVMLVLKSLSYISYLLKFKYFEKATKFCEILVPVKSKVKILQKFAAFTETLIQH